jgi:1-acyl-sn-glycerol-3-phosphate acyltransferase
MLQTMQQNGMIPMSKFLLYMLITFPPRIFIALGWWKWRVEGLEHLPPRDIGGMIIVSNHVHWLDILVLGTLVPYTHLLSWFGKIELFESRFGNWFFTTMDVVPVKRGKGDFSAMRTTMEALKEGAVFAVFPEGHRNPEGTLQKGQGGTIRIAMQSNVPIIPAAITGSEHGLRGAFFGKELKLKFGPAYVMEPTDGQKIPAKVTRELANDMMYRIAALLPEERRGAYGE